MTNELFKFLEGTLDDARLSRAEVKALLTHFKDEKPESGDVDLFAMQALRLARTKLRETRDEDVLQWLYDVLKVVRRAESREAPSGIAIAAFSPGDEPKQHIKRLIGNTRSQIDCCVFTITDNELADALLQAHKRGVALRILSDNDKSSDRGSDIEKLSQNGIPVRVDRSDAHMHHKFALFDRHILLTGSYNWTRSAARENAENIIITDDPRLITPFQTYFDDLWKTLQ